MNIPGYIASKLFKREKGSLSPDYTMNTEAKLEYSVTPEQNSWGFQFKDGSGQILIDSSGYPSLEQAQQGFISLVKSIATNQYSVAFPDSVSSPPKRKLSS